ncbi:MAG TPA: exosortase H-associated membrane protein [Rhodanobacteraceae bacterium]|nr:exosortase H-associated membrane protein [Rhodanobacteraceae bacterium]
MRFTPVHELALKAALWLPLSFVLWFYAAALWTWPAARIAKLALLACWPALFTNLVQGGDVLDASGHVIGHASYLLTLTTAVIVNVPGGAGGAGGIGVLEPTLNPMVYAYALPLFAGLAMATPLSTRRRLVELAIAFIVISLTQAFGIVAESLKFVAFDAGPPGAAAIAQAKLAPNAIALAYQFGYLILPAVAPAALWIGLNRGFIERLVRRDGEPGVRTAV